MSGLLAGTASADVTPPVGLWNVGAQRSERIRDDLRATALVLQVGSERLAIVSVEVIQLIRESVAAIRERVAAETGIPAERALVLYAHTHSSPITRPSRGKMPDDDYVRVLEKSAAGAVMMAAQRLVPARIAFGEGRIGFNVNRRRMTPGGVQMLPNPDGPVDRSARSPCCSPCVATPRHFRRARRRGPITPVPLAGSSNISIAARRRRCSCLGPSATCGRRRWMRKDVFVA